MRNSYLKLNVLPLSFITYSNIIIIHIYSNKYRGLAHKKYFLQPCTRVEIIAEIDFI